MDKIIESTHLSDTQIFRLPLFSTRYDTSDTRTIVKELKDWLETKAIVKELSWFYFENEEDRVEMLFRFGDHIKVKSLSESTYPYCVDKLQGFK